MIPFITGANQPCAACSPAPYSIVSTPNHDLHRRRRNALNSFFSIASIRRLDVVMEQYVNKMLARMEATAKHASDPVLQFHHMFKACASDVITIYAFGECFGFMELPDFGWPFFESTDKFFFLTHLFFLIPGLVNLAQNAPSWLVRAVLPGLAELRDRQEVSILVHPFSLAHFGPQWAACKTPTRADLTHHLWETVVAPESARDQELAKPGANQEHNLRGHPQQHPPAGGKDRRQAGSRGPAGHIRRRGHDR
jgi:hypothetical protein